MMFYGMIELDADGTPVGYLPFLGAKGWQPGSPAWVIGRQRTPV
jgi:hypothetical protein